MLSVENIEVSYGKIRVVDGVSLEVSRGRLVALLGANGAGKTTVLNAISGFLSARKGAIRYKGERIDGLEPDQIVGRGIAQVSQDRDLFPDLSVLDNLKMGAVLRKDSTAIAQSLRRVFRYFKRLEERQKQMAKSLSGGEQQMLAIGRALMSNPELILLDEPTTGLAPIIVSDISQIIRAIQRAGTTILLVEQNAKAAVSLADYYYILRDGQVVKDGSTDSLPNDLKGFFREYYI